MNRQDSSLADRLARDYLRLMKGSVSRVTPRDAGGSGFIFEIDYPDGAKRALKLFRPDQLNDRTLVEGFKQEGKFLCQVRHSRIVQGYETGSARFPSVNGKRLPFYLMEFFPHDSLEKVLPRLGRDSSIVVSLLTQALEALSYIHSLGQGLVHLDVKEANLLVDLSEPLAPSAKLSDFGVAKVLSKDDGDTEVRGTLYYWPAEWQVKLRNRLPTNAKRAAILLPRSEIPASVDLHMLSVTFQRVLDALLPGDHSSYWHRALSILLDRMNWDSSRWSQKAEKYQTSAQVLRGLEALVSVPALPDSLREHGSVRVPVVSLTSFGSATRELIDSPWFQRLRRIRQLGVAHLVYPGATHTRFEHALGTYSQTLHYLKALFENKNSPWFTTNFTPEETKALALTALAHDLGHYPFAHQLEDLEELGEWPKHELLSYEILVGTASGRWPKLQSAYGPPLLGAVAKHWKVDPGLLKAMFRYCYRSDLPRNLMPSAVPRAWRAASQIVNGPIDADKFDYLRRDAHHTGVSYGQMGDQSRFLSSLTIAFDDEGTHLAVTEKGRVDAEFVPVVRYAMFSEVYWHHTVRSFTSMLRRALKVGFALGRSPLSLEDLLLRSDEELIAELEERAGRRRPSPSADLVRLIKHRCPYGRLYTLTRQANPSLYDELSARRIELMAGKQWKTDVRIVEEYFGLKGLGKNDVLWDIPKPGKDRLGEVRIADLHGQVVAQNPGHLWTSLSGNFEQWVRKIRLFVHPKNRAIAQTRAEEERRVHAVTTALCQRFGV